MPSKKISYSLIDFLMVMTIIGILTVVTIPRLEVFYSIKFRAAAKKLASDIKYVQNVAISQHINTSIVFYTANDTYRANFTDNGTLINDPFTRYPLLMDYNDDSQYAGIDIIAVNIGGNNALRFDWQGIPQNSVGSNLTANGTIVLRYRDFDDIYLNVTPYIARVE